MKIRLDALLVEKGLVSGRSRAKELIENGGVCVDGKVSTKAALLVENTCDISITGQTLKYVGRGGLKLEHALSHFNISVEGLTCADIGASTGGFTDCMLDNGAKLVYAIDVGHGQLAQKLIDDKRVINMEGINVKELNADSFDISPQFVGADLSFISLKTSLPYILSSVDDDCKLVLLIKPQFEAGKSAVGKGGIVKDKKLHKKLLDEMLVFFSSVNCHTLGLTYSSIRGGDGNIEYLAYLVFGMDTEKTPDCFDTKAIVEEAFTILK